MAFSKQCPLDWAALESWKNTSSASPFGSLSCWQTRALRPVYFAVGRDAWLLVWLSHFLQDFTVCIVSCLYLLLGTNSVILQWLDKFCRCTPGDAPSVINNSPTTLIRFPCFRCALFPSYLPDLRKSGLRNKYIWLYLHGAALCPTQGIKSVIGIWSYQFYNAIFFVSWKL